MSHFRIRMLALSSLLALVACSNATTMDGAEQMQAALSDARVENHRHATACDVASSMPTMMDELGRHESAMGGLLGRMEEARAHMRSDGDWGHCMGGGFQHMSRGLDDLRGAMVEHGSRMRATEVVVDARNECNQHASAAAMTMNGMMSDLESMHCTGR